MGYGSETIGGARTIGQARWVPLPYPERPCPLAKASGHLGELWIGVTAVTGESEGCTQDGLTFVGVGGSERFVESS